MFEAEEQLEKRSYGLHFLIILLVVLAVGVGVFYYFMQQQKPLSPEQATLVLKDAIRLKGPAMVHFHGGAVQPSVDEKPRDPHYRLLQKAGYINTKPMTGGGLQVALTPLGEGTFTKFPEFKKSKNPDGTEAYLVPLAERELTAVSAVKMTGPNTASVEYTWKWVPNTVGDNFDASGKLVQGFTSWDRAVLIQKYGVDFYHGAAAKTTVDMVRTDKGWKIAAE